LTAAMRQVLATLDENSPNYAVSIVAAGHALASDEHKGNGGQATAPAPPELILAGLCSCTAITLRMYAQRKQWPLGTVQVAATLESGGDSNAIERRVTVSGNLDAGQKARLADICERTPMTLLLKRGAAIHTVLS
jgi:putative redox protein